MYITQDTPNNKSDPAKCLLPPKLPTNASQAMTLTQFMKVKAELQDTKQEYIYLKIGTLERGDIFVSVCAQ